MLWWAPSSRLSSTLIEAKTPRPSGTRQMPARTLRSTGRPVMGAPLKRISPAVGGLMPSTVCSSVVLPAPLAPISTTISPRNTSRLASFSAFTCP